jgi:membrane protease YdiL (CAAX protease family)
LIAALPRRSATLRAGALAALVVALEWSRAIMAQQPRLTLAALLIGGAALIATAFPFSGERLGLGSSRLGLRLLGGIALGAVLLLPAAVRPNAVPLIPAWLAAAAVVVSIGEELAFRGVLYAALDDLGGAPLAIVGSTLMWTVAHVLSHPPAFLGAVAAAGLLLAVWRWACKDLVGPIVGHVIADLAL